jgi:hypothetical protein
MKENDPIEPKSKVDSDCIVGGIGCGFLILGIIFFIALALYNTWDQWSVAMIIAWVKGMTVCEILVCLGIVCLIFAFIFVEIANYIVDTRTGFTGFWGD